MILGRNNMIFRKVEIKETAQIEKMYKMICRDMRNHHINIWDYNYPCKVIKDDILKGQLYGFFSEDICTGAFALCTSEKYEESIQWSVPARAALYCERIAVNVSERHKGMGKALYEEAMRTASERGCKALRAMIVDVNIPAIQLCEKIGFTKRPGWYENRVDENHILKEYGFEIML